MIYEAWVDGSWGPLGLGIGVAVYHGKDRVFVMGAREKRNGTNNVAEYLALNYVLRWFRRNNLMSKKIIIYTDSAMVASQATGKKAVVRGAYVAEAAKARELIKEFPNLSVVWIPREANTEADALSKL